MNKNIGGAIAPPAPPVPTPMLRTLDQAAFCLEGNRTTNVIFKQCTDECPDKSDVDLTSMELSTHFLKYDTLYDPTMPCISGV